MVIDKLFFFPDNQITARIVKEINWSGHPLGHPSTWPVSLRLTLNTLFTTRQALSLFWGDQNYFFYNDAYIPMMGKTKHPHSMGKPGAVVWSEIWDLFLPQIEGIRKTGEASWYADQCIPIYRNGETSKAYFTYNCSPVIDEDGKNCGVLVIGIENTDKVISEKKLIATQEELFEALEQFKLMSDSLPQLVWTSLPSGECNYLNKQWVDYTGRSEESQLGYKWIDMAVHPDDRAMTKTHWIGAVKGLHPYDVEYRIKRYDGVYRWFKVRGSPYKNNQGKTIIWFGTCTDIDDTKQQQLNYEKNVDLSPAMLWITEPNGYCIYLSNQWYQMTGQSVDEGLGYGWLDATHPDDKEKSAKAFEEANTKHISFELEYRLRNKDGEYRWSIDAGNPRFGPHGEYLGMAGTVFDVHEKKLAEEALVESRRDLYRVLMQAPSAVAFLKGPELIYSLANSRYREIFGKDESLIGKPMRVALPQVAEESHRIFERVFATGEPFVAKEFKSTAIDHRDDVYYSFAVQRINNSKGEAEGVIVIGDDVTDQVKDRMAREELNRNLQAIVQNMAEGLILADHNGKMLIWNPAACKMHGFENLEDSYDEIHNYSKLFQLYTTEGDVLEIEDWPISQVLRGESFTGREVIVEHLDNSYRWIGSYNGSPVFDENGNLVLAVLTIRDVTSRIMFEQDLKKAINSRDEFLSIISHELKTPLTSLKLQNQSALRKIRKGNTSDLTSDKLSILFDKNESQINRVTRLVDDMLDLTRIQSGKLSYNFEKCDLRDIVVDVYDRFKEQFENADTELVNQCIDSVEGYFDRDRMEQVLVNLLTNALKYGEGKAVFIRLERINKTARLEILDHGMGISPENFEIIFKKYERVVSADEVSGLGIGLFISKEIVEAHGGKIWVESAIGKGAKFIAELPVDSDNLKK